MASSSIQAQNTRLSAADYYVRSLPGLDSSQHARFKLHSGHVKAEQDAGALFFLLVEYLYAPSNNKLVIWFNGGPGCSSMDGAFLESGPFQVNFDLSLKINEAGWHNSAPVLYVDQPAGTGFSYVENDLYMTTQKDIAAYFVKFFREFLNIFPEYSQSEIYLAGESFAGVYIPYFADALLTASDAGEFAQQLKLSGLLIGNGWIDPLPQYKSYLEFGRSHNILTGEFLKSAQLAYETCTQLYAKEQRIKFDQCETIVNSILDESVTGGKLCLNMYDIRLRDNGPNQQCGLYSWPPRLYETTKYLQQPSVRDALHATQAGKKWVECDDTVGSRMRSDLSPPSVTLFPELLKRVRITMFNGDQDLICNWIGGQAVFDRLAKPTQLKTFDWKVDDVPAGTVSKSLNLTYVVVYNASHMVAVDQPKAALDILEWTLDLKHAVVHSPEIIVTSPSPSPKISPLQLSPTPSPESLAPATNDNTEKDASTSFGIGASVIVIVVIIALGIIGVLYMRRRMRTRRGKGKPEEWHELATEEEIFVAEDDEEI